MKTKPVLAVMIISLTGLTAGQAADNIEPEPGLIKADSPLYGLDKAFDSISKNQTEVAFERASEYAVAETPQAREKAIRQVNNSIAQVASNNTTEGLEKAKTVLQQVKDETPSRADPGLDQAIENLGKAQRGELNTEDVGGKPEAAGRP